MSNINCYYAENCRFDSFFDWFRATQHCACNKWLPTCQCLKSSVNLQSCSNLQSQNRTDSCEWVQKKIISSYRNLFKRNWQHPNPSIYWNVARFQYKYMFISGHFHVLSMRKPHFQCNANREVATTPSFLHRTAHIACSFVKVATGTTFTSWSKHHFVVTGKAEQKVHKASHCGTKQQ